MPIIRRTKSPVLIPRDVIENPDVGILELALYTFICSFPEGENIKNDEIHIRFPHGKRSICHALTALRVMGLISYDGPIGTEDSLD